MDTRISISNHRRMRGDISFTVLFSALIVIVAVIAGWFLVIKPHLNVTHFEVPVQVVHKKVRLTKSAPVPTNVSMMTTEQLLSAAARAVREERLLSPQGNNAFEFYLKVLGRQPDNQVAKDALRETFPFGVNEAEYDINRRNFNEASREIDLLTKADPDNFTLTILRSKLGAQRKTASKQKQEQIDLLDKQLVAQQQQEAEAMQKQAAAEAKQREDAAARQSKAAAAARQRRARLAKSKQAAKAKPAQAKSVAATTRVSIEDAVRTSKADLHYPIVAYRRRQEGWVDVQFTVDTNGKVKNVTVVGANPKHVFERAATSAVGHWKYRPALNNGTPFPVTMRRRIEFKLGNR